jgi:hypothetical protein
MPTAPIRTCAFAFAALLAALVLSGCGAGSDEPSIAVAVAKSGVLGPIGDQLKREDDEAEMTEIREHAPHTREEREELHEQAEEATIAAGQEQQEEGGSGQQEEGGSAPQEEAGSEQPEAQ